MSPPPLSETLFLTMQRVQYMKFSVKMWPAGTPNCFSVLSKLSMKGCGPHMYIMHSCTRGTCSNMASPQLEVMHELTKDETRIGASASLEAAKPKLGRKNMDRASVILHTGCRAGCLQEGCGHATCKSLPSNQGAHLKGSSCDA